MIWNYWIEDDTGCILCKDKGWQRPNVYWSKLACSYDNRINYTLLGAYFQKLIIKLLASDIKTKIIRREKW